MLCPHCGNEMYSQATNLLPINNSAACDSASAIWTNGVYTTNINLAAGCNPTIAYPVSGTLKFHYNAATDDMTQMQEEK